MKDTLSNQKVLLAEDNTDTRNLLIDTLRTIGLRKITAVKDGELAIKESESHTFDIVFLDIEMPKLSGIEVLKQLKESNPNMFIVIISANSTLEYVQQCANLKADGYLVKPFSIDRLKNIISIYENKADE